MGRPIEIVLDEEARRVEALVLAEHIDRCLGTGTWRRRALFHLTLHAGAASGSMPAPWDPAARVVKWNLIRAWQAGDDSFLASLHHLNRHVVTSMPSTIELASSRLESIGAAGSIAPLLLVLSGETLDDAVRRQAEGTFDCPVTSLYTLAEAGIVGSECPLGGYHVEDHVVVVEILDGHSRRVPPDETGEIVITPLSNRAMPLIRYRTGDRGRWADARCGCGRSGDRFALDSGRRPVSLVSASGAAVSTVRFAKVISGLDVDHVELRGGGPGAVRVRYQSPRALDLGARSLLESALRSALGPTARIAIERVGADGPVRATGAPADTAVRPEPAGPSPPEVAAWLGDVLARRPGVEAAVLTGSYLDPEATTRFSDIDVVVLLEQSAGEAFDSSVPFVRELRVSVPLLRVNFDALRGLPDRAPLLSCRLLLEQFPVLGALSSDNLPWPSTDVIRRHGRFWVQEAEARLWSALTDPEVGRRDPLRTAWLAAKHSLDALRYLFLCRRERVTAARPVLARALTEGSPDWLWIGDVREAFDVAREHSPPPDAAGDGPARYLAAALLCLRFVAARL